MQGKSIENKTFEEIRIGDSARLERQRLGIWVILFLVTFTIIAYFLKREYWKDVH